MDLGNFTNINPETGDKLEIAVSNFVKAPFKDGRSVVVAELEDGSMYVQITNPDDTGRNPLNQMWLSRESFVALSAATMLHYEATGKSPDIEIAKAIDGNELNFEFSPNLSPVV